MDRLAIGVDLGGTQIKFGLVERGEGLITQYVCDTRAEEGPEAVIERIVDGIGRLRDEASPRAVHGIGIGAPGGVDLARTTVIYPSNLPGWEILNLSQAVRTQVGEALPVVVENDANAAAFGSNYHGAGRAFESFIMVTLGTGVGGAIVHQGRLFRGTTGAAGEIGHVSIDYEGPYDRAGVAGAVEAYLGQRFLSRHARYHLRNRQDSLLHDMAGGELREITPRLLYDAARAGDDGAVEFFAWAGHKLGHALASCVNLLDIRKVVVGGGVSQAGEFLLGPARTTLRRAVMPGLREGLEMVRETKGNEVGMLGAAYLAFEYGDERAPSV